jgi:flagellar basal-body rod protein FlgB
VQNSLEPTRLNGNNVNLDEESLAHIDTMMRYQLTIRALDGKYGLLRDAIKGA